MANSKDEILQSLRATSLEEIPRPTLDQPWTEFEDCRAQFIEALSTVGGQAVVLESPEELAAELEKLPAYRDAQKVCSLVGGVAKANVPSDAVQDPHDLEDVDFFVAPGEFGVAENGAVWLTGRSTKHRVLYFICQHMALVVPASELVSNMHQAYRRISFEASEFGMFLSGPSKTADIEQSLVIGAHGVRSLTVFLVKEDE